MVNGRASRPDTRLSRSDRLAGGDGDRRAGLFADLFFSEGRGFWHDVSTAALRGIHPGEYRRGIWSRAAQVLHPVPSRGSGFAQGAGDPCTIVVQGRTTDARAL